MLSSVIVHNGLNLQQGHYVSYVCTRSGWYKFDDASVSIIVQRYYVHFESDFCIIIGSKN